MQEETEKFGWLFDVGRVACLFVFVFLVLGGKERDWGSGGSGRRTTDPTRHKRHRGRASYM